MTSPLTFLEAVKARRSLYGMDKNLGPLTPATISSIVKDLAQSVPSGFNSQSNRCVVLFGAEHEKLWGTIVADTLKAKVSEEQWKSTGPKIERFKGAAGTVLYFVDEKVVAQYESSIPAIYADKMKEWATQSEGMLQFAVWTALEAEGLGVNLQHYNPIINEQVTETWDLPAEWRLTAQMTFGGRVGPHPEELTKTDVEEKVKVFGA